MLNENDPDYSLEEIIENLESLRSHGLGEMNPWKAFLCLAKEIKELKQEITYGKTYQRFKP